MWNLCTENPGPSAEVCLGLWNIVELWHQKERPIWPWFFDRGTVGSYGCV